MENLNAEHIKNVLEVEIGFSDGKITKIEVSVLKDALALITSQEQRIKELEVENVQFRHKQKKLIEERDVYKTWAYNKNALINSMTDKIESGYEPSAARACAEAEMWQRIALREKELTEENERLQKANGLFKYLSEAVHWVEIDGKWEMVDFKDKTFAINKMVNKLVDIQNCRADTVRKMQERLKAEMRNTAKYSFGGREYSVIGEGFIDQIAKEMLESDDG